MFTSAEVQVRKKKGANVTLFLISFAVILVVYFFFQFGLIKAFMTSSD